MTASRRVELVEVDRSNWRSVAAVTPKPEQAEFVAPTLRYLCLAAYDGEWNPLAVLADGEVVGHVMWAVDPDDDSTWIGGFVIDAAWQGRGVGSVVLELLVERFTRDGTVDMALSYSPANLAAKALYEHRGFVETGEMEDDEVVARLRTTR